MVTPKETPWAVLLCKFSPDLTTGYPMGYFAQVPGVVYRSKDNHINELAISQKTGMWDILDITAQTGAPAAAGDPMGYFAQVPRVVYRSQDNHIWELSIDPQAGAWGKFDMTASTGAPGATGDPMGYLAQVPRVVYRGQDNHIYEIAIYPETGNWGLFDMSSAPAAVEPIPRSFYENMFTTSGIGLNNMLDFFRLFTHGNIDLTQSQVFGWLTLNQSKRDYTGSGVNSDGRQALIAWARNAAAAAHIDLSPYSGVVVCMNVPTDLFGNLGEKAVVCDPGSRTPSMVAQEMLHGYGLDHSRADDPNLNLLGCLSPPPDYRDPWDVMSTACAYMAPDPNFARIGPSLNAANMDGQGWLDPSRVWSADGNFDETVDLRPHYRRDLPGFLVARVGRFYVEFRVKEGWDAAIPQSAVLVHRFDGNHSYLMGSPGLAALTVGSGFQEVDQVILPPLTIVSHVEVLKIDVGARQATVHLSYTVTVGSG